MPRWLTQADIEVALSPQTLVQLTDDDRDGIADAGVIAFVIEEAEAEVEGFLVGKVNLDELATDRLLRLCALEFCISFLFRRHPEYVHTFGEHHRTNSLYKRAVDRMNRIQNADQQLPDLARYEAVKPRNVGGIVMDPGHRMFISNPDGSSNSGDF